MGIFWKTNTIMIISYTYLKLITGTSDADPGPHWFGSPEWIWIGNAGPGPGERKQKSTNKPDFQPFKMAYLRNVGMVYDILPT